jgi:capsular exopolysaccharide synthesis family protein
MSRIDEALKRASSSPAVDAPLIRDRFVIAGKPRARVEDYVAEQIVSSESLESNPGLEPPTVRTPAPPVKPRQRERGRGASYTPPDLEAKLVTNKGTNPVSVEQYRRLASALFSLQRGRSFKVLMVTSAAPREGKTLTSSNLAMTLSELYGQRVLLIDGDLRRPSIHEVFGIPNTAGLSDGLLTPDKRLQLVQVTPQLSILPGGCPDVNSMAGLISERMRAVLKEAADRFDWVILDSPPVGLISDARIMADLVDGVIVVIGAGSTPHQAIERAVEELGRDRIVGTVLNRVDHDEGQPSHYLDHYYSRPNSTNEGA